jgi:hypothetical protein
MLYKISEFDIETLSISSTKDATYVQSNKQPFELQTDWITLCKYPLPSKRFITDDAKSMNLTVRITRNDENYTMLSAFDDIHSKLNIAQYKKYHPLVGEKDNEHYIKFKLYLNTLLFDKDKSAISITSLFDFYKYLKEDTKIKIVFGFSKLWQMGREYGFSLSVKRILLKDEVKEVPLETNVSFLDD